jgi:hypothetical protein
MRASFLAVGAAGAAVLVSAFAGTRTSPSMHPESLARTEAISSYCGEMDPARRPLYLSRLTDLTRGHSQQEIAEERQSNRYRRAMSEANETLTKASPRTGLRGCSEFLDPK